MATKPQVSIINDMRRPSGGLWGVVNATEIDWEPGDQPVPFDPALTPVWRAIQRHMRHPRPPVTTITQRVRGQ